MKVVPLAEVEAPANQELLRCADIVSVTDRLRISRYQRLWGQGAPATGQKRVEILCNLDSPAELSRAQAALARAKSARIVTVSRADAELATIIFLGCA